MSLEVVKAENGTGLFTIKSSQGPIPKILEGRYTSTIRAQTAIDMYNKSKERKPDKRLKENKDT